MSDKFQGETVINENGSPPKRKRGRPRKNPENKGVTNETETRIIMGNNTSNNTSNNTLNSSVIQTQTQDDLEKISLQQIQRKWNAVFNKSASLINSGANIDTIIANPAYINRLNPFVNNQRVKSIISQGLKIDKNKIIEYCEDPQNNEFNLQNASWAMYYQSQVYQSLLRIDRETPRFYHYAIPEDIKVEELSKDSYKKERKKVNSILKVLKPIVTFKDIITQMSNEGKCFYVPRVSYDENQANFFTFQKLPSQYCKIVGFGSDDHFIIMFDMSLFLSGTYDPAQYPDFIRDKWDEMIESGIVMSWGNGIGYKDLGKGIVDGEESKYRINPKANIPEGDILEHNNDSWFYWYRIPQNLCFTFSQDGGSPNVLPDTVGLLQDVVDLADYKQLQQSLLAKGATAILTAEALVKTDSPVGKDGTYVSPETLLGISDYVGQRVGDTIVPVFFPLHDYKLHSIQEDVSPATTVVTSRIKDVVNTSALGGLMSTTDKPSIITVKTARDLQEAKMRYYVSQFENAVNRIINTSFGLKYKWKVVFHGYCFSDLDEKKLLKELVLSGMKGLLPALLSCYNVTLEDYAMMYNMAEAEGIKIIKDELIYQIEATQEMQTESLNVSQDMQDKSLEAGMEQAKIGAKAKGVPGIKIKDTGINETKKRGRPAKPDTDSDSTAASQEGGGNDSEVKGFIKDTFGDLLSPDELEEVIAEELMSEIENTNEHKPKI